MTVQYSIQKMVSDGTLSTIALGIQYLQRNDIYMRIAGEDTPQVGAPSGYTWSFINNTTLKILPVVPNGVEVVVYRRTDVDAMYNIYSQNAQFDEATIDENNQQLLYIAQEYLEQGLPGTGVDTIEYVRDDGSFTYYRMRRTDGSYSEEFTVPSASNSTKVLTRESLRRIYAEAGYNLVDGSFEAGGTLVNTNDVLLQESTGKAFTGPAGPVAAGTNPASGGFVDRSGALLRADVYILINEKRRNISHYLTKAEFDDAQTGNPQLDTTAAWNAALNDSSIRALDFKGGFKVTGTGKACITQTENISLHGNNRRDTFIRADNAGANTAILDLAISNNGGMGDVRGWAAEHFSIFHNNGGSSCILNDSGLPMLECRIVDISARAGVTAGSRDLLMTRFAFSKVEQCSFGSGVTCGLPAHQAPDGNKFLMNNFFGTPTALILDIEPGAYRTEVYGGAMVTRDGGVRVLRGSQIAIKSVQFEQFLAYGQSQSPEKAHIAILGTGQLSDSILIEGNNFGGGTNCDYLVWVGNAVDTDITKNIMNAPAVADVYTSFNAQFTKPRTDNVVKGNQSNPRPHNVRFPMVVADNGYGTYNVLHQQTALANGWLGGSFYLNELNEIVIDTGFNAGVTAPGTLVATMPYGFRPADFYVLTAVSASGVGVINANPTTGQLTVGLAPSNSQFGCQMRFPARRG